MVSRENAWEMSGTPRNDYPLKYMLEQLARVLPTSLPRVIFALPTWDKVHRNRRKQYSRNPKLVFHDLLWVARYFRAPRVENAIFQPLKLLRASPPSRNFGHDPSPGVPTYYPLFYLTLFHPLLLSKQVNKSHCKLVKREKERTYVFRLYLA